MSEPTKIPFSFVQRVITPEEAGDILDNRNTRNRPINLRIAGALSESMTEEDWDFNGDTIRFDWFDILLDGQNRLWACRDSGVPLDTLVVNGLDPAVFDTIDIGKKRTPADTLAVAGFKNCTALGSALVVLDKYKTGKSENVVRYNNDEVLMLVEMYPTMATTVSEYSSRRKLLPPSIGGACLYLFSEKDPVQARQFIADVFSGVGLKENSPALLLRNRLLQNKLGKAKLPHPELMALVIKAWNAFRQNKPMKALVYRNTGDSPEKFPEVV